MRDDVLYFRVLDEATGDVLVSQEVTLDEGDRIEDLADRAGEFARAHADAGGVALLQCQDPAGDILPAGEWVTLDRVHLP